MKNGIPSILVIRLSALGDVARVLPAVRAIRETYPKARIDWAVEAKAAPLLDQHPDIDELIIFERPSGILRSTRAFLRFLATISANHYDIVLDFHGILKSGLAVAVSHARERYGFSRPRSQEASWLFTNKKVRLPRKDLNRIEENLLLAEAFGAKRRTNTEALHIAEDVQEEVDDFFDNVFDGVKRVIAMHPPVERPEKQWPLEHFARLADLLLADGRFDVLLTWGPGQFPIAEAVKLKTRRNLIIAPATPSIKHYAWLAHRSDLYFGGDTGPMHIAAAMGTPVVAVFGGTDPAKHTPLGATHEVLFIPPSRPITPRRLLATAAARLAQITPEMAYDACIRIALPDSKKR